MAYWPPAHLVGGDTRTATFSLALDATRKANGCLKFIPGSQAAQKVRPHVPIGGSRDDAHAIAIKVDEAVERIEYVEIDRCDVTIHDEFVVHGSGGNTTDGHRRTYVAAWRTAACVAKEREMGFDHSHNTDFNWDKFNKW
jgi:phytanoyl-CoA hydroxylase